MPKSSSSYLCWLLGLCLGAGYLNVTTLLEFALTSSHLTGHLSHLAVQLAAGNILLAFKFLFVLGSFYLGGCLSGLLNPKRRPENHRATKIILGSILVLLAWRALGGLPPVSQAYAISFALGMQNSLALFYDGQIIRTTHYTGTITDFSVATAQALSGQPSARARLGVLGSSILIFILGGLLASWLVAFPLIYVGFPLILYLVLWATSALMSWA